MRPLFKSKLIAMLALASSAMTAVAAIPVEWMPSETDEQRLFASALQQSGIVQDAATLDRVDLDWPERLVIRLVADGTPDYQAETQTIVLPYTYLAAATRAQDNFEESRGDAFKRGLDMVEYTLYHLLGHALQGHHDEADDTGVERVATWLMVSQFPNGGEQWLENTHAFGRASQKLDGPLSDYWHSHGLYKSRERAINCLVFGSDIEHFSTLYPGLTENPDTARECVRQWRELAAEYAR